MVSECQESLGTVAVVGLGLIGGSLARALHAAGVAVAGFDADPATREAAAAAGIDTVDDLAELRGREVELAVLAVPLRAIERTAEVLAEVLPAGATLTDVGSAKAAVRGAIFRAGLSSRYVGAHPMAGTEQSGFSASTETLLSGAAWAVTIDGEPSSAYEPEVRRHVDRVLALITGVMRGRALVLTDDDHDAAVARVSHVPHVLAAELLAGAAQPPLAAVALALAAGSFRDGTRVARTDPARTQAMIEHNAAWVASAVRQAASDLLLLADDLEAEASTSWFFDRRPLPAPQALEAGPGEGPVLPRADLVGWTADWRSELLAAGRQARFVVGVDAAGVQLDPSR